jgi:hypothetical protein
MKHSVNKLLDNYNKWRLQFILVNGINPTPVDAYLKGRMDERTEQQLLVKKLSEATLKKQEKPE